MKFILFAVCYLEFLGLRTVICSSSSDSQLLMAKVIFRNGQEHPPNQEVLNKFLHERYTFDIEPFNTTGIKEEAKINMYNFGAKIRRWYSGKLFNKPKPGKDKIKIESTSNKDCQESAKYVKDGVFKNSFNKKNPQSTVETSSDELLTYFYKNEKCKAKSKMNGVPYKPSDFKFVFETRNKLVKNLNITLYPNGNPIASNSPDPHPIKAQHIWKIYEYFQAKRFEKTLLPDWLTENMMFDMEESNKLFMKEFLKWDFIKYTSGGGVFANLILEEFEKKMSNNNNQNVLQLLCAQEIIVATAISALTNSKTSICDRTIDIGVVKHGTALIAELHKKNNEYYVKVFLWNPDADEPKQIKYAECSNGECTFEMFKNMLKNTAITKDKLQNSVYCKK